MKQNIEELRQRTRAYALRILHMYNALPRTQIAFVLGNQALRSGTSVGAQYREACRARSDAEIISKLEATLQELDETAYWLELLVDAEVVTSKRLASLQKETDELTAIFVTSVKRIKARPRKRT